MKLQKVIDSPEKHGKWYGDACGTAFAMELVGERWSMLIIRELMLGGRRFSDIRARLPGISAKVLTERLNGLEQAGVLVKRKLPPPAEVQVYELTEWGYLAEPAIQELGRWAAQVGLHRPAVLTAVAAVVSNLVSNVPAVLLFKPIIPTLGEPDRAWLILAMASTLAGNLTLIGSVANLIVVEAARTARVEIGFLEYCRVGVPLTLITLLLGWLVLVLVPV